MRPGVLSSFDELLASPSTYKTLFFYGSRMGVHRNDIEDLIQETLCAAKTAEARYNDSMPFKPWIIGILRHKRSDELDKRHHRLRYFNSNEEGIIEQAVTSYISDPLTRVIQKEMGEKIQQYLTRLSTPNQSSFRLRFFQELSPQEICRSQNIHPKTMSSRVHRAVQEMRSYLQDHYFDYATT